MTDTTGTGMRVCLQDGKPVMDTCVVIGNDNKIAAGGCVVIGLGNTLALGPRAVNKGAQTLFFGTLHAPAGSNVRQIDEKEAVAAIPRKTRDQRARQIEAVLQPIRLAFAPPPPLPPPPAPRQAPLPTAVAPAAAVTAPRARRGDVKLVDFVRIRRARRTSRSTASDEEDHNDDDDEDDDDEDENDPDYDPTLGGFIVGEDEDDADDFQLAVEFFLAGGSRPVRMDFEADVLAQSEQSEAQRRDNVRKQLRSSLQLPAVKWTDEKREAVRKTIVAELEGILKQEQTASKKRKRAEHFAYACMKCRHAEATLVSKSQREGGCCGHVFCANCALEFVAKAPSLTCTVCYQECAGFNRLFMVASSTKNPSQCGVCLIEQLSSVLPCGHAMCVGCTHKVGNECPHCRTKFVSAFPLFLPPDAMPREEEDTDPFAYLPPASASSASASSSSSSSSTLGPRE